MRELRFGLTNPFGARVGEPAYREPTTAQLPPRFAGSGEVTSGFGIPSDADKRPRRSTRRLPIEKWAAALEKRPEDIKIVIDMTERA